MSEWTRSDIIALIGVIVAVLTFAGEEILRRSKRSRTRDIIIQTPRNHESIPIIHGEKLPIKRLLEQLLDLNKKRLSGLDYMLRFLSKQIAGIHKANLLFRLTGNRKYQAGLGEQDI